MTDLIHDLQGIAGLNHNEIREMTSFDHLYATAHKAADEIEQLRAENERLRESAKTAYITWACGEPLDEDMKELGTVLGFKVDVT